jgi:MoxR-like ATPase
MERQTAEITEKIESEIHKIIIGKERQIRLILAALLAKGHVLLDDMPGVGKTTLIKTLAHTLGFDYKRIQFTPDLLPSDVIGMNIFDRERNAFTFLPGPVHTNILLADEINRAIPRTQSALLESMEERQVTIDGETKPLPRPFFVLATQNPVEQESTFQLPAAQMDRFMIRLSLGYPTAKEEAQMMKRMSDGLQLEMAEVVTNAEEFRALQEHVQTVEMNDALVDYIVQLVQKTRSHPQIRHGASPRASLALAQISKAYAAMQGRSFVIPDDVKECAAAVLAHRLVIAGQMRMKGQAETACVEEILAQTPVPPGKEQIIHGA